MNSQIDQIIRKVANAFLPGDNEFYKILSAIALTESGGRPDAVGDGGWSIGLFQNHMRDGRGVGHTREQLMDPLYNAALAAKELVKYYLQGKQKGIKGPQLAVYVSKYGQRPAPGNELKVVPNYGKSVGQAPVVTNESQMRTVNDGTVTVNPVEIPPQKNPNEILPTGPINQQAPGRVQFQKDFSNYQKNPGKPKGIFDVIDMILSATTPQAYAQGPTQKPMQNQYVVKPNDTLWGIAQNTLGSGSRWKELQGYTGSPTQLPIGTKLTIPQPKPKPVVIPTMSSKPTFQQNPWLTNPIFQTPRI